MAFHHSGYFDHFSYPLRDTKNEIPYTDGLDFVSRSLLRSIKKMESAGKSVVLIYDLPDLQDGEPINCLLKESRLGKIGECDRREIFRYDFEKYEKLISQVLSQTGAKVFYTHDYLNNFPRSWSGDWLYRDGTHLSLKGSFFFSSKYIKLSQ